MQDIESMGDGRRIFGGAADRRLRPQHHQALKCPRCDSVNTKFCYYNNYNLSQPRHFCKACRRYWTRGGVLRNVPVGGGCRKTKRSSKPKPPEQNKSTSHSSSESSSLTAAATAETVSEPKVSIVQNTTSPSLEQALLERSSDYGMFSEMGNLTSLMTNPPTYGLNDAADTSQFRMNQDQPKVSMIGDEDGEIQEMTGGLLDHDGGFGSLDWASGGGADQGLFDQTYWSHTQCNYQDHPILFLP